jgi:hypothetical protein
LQSARADSHENGPPYAKCTFGSARNSATPDTTTAAMQATPGTMRPYSRNPVPNNAL